MKQEKPSLAIALPSELGAPFFPHVVRSERFKLNGHVRKHGGKERRLREGEADMVDAIWSRTVGIKLPAALTVQSHTYAPDILVVTALGLEYCDWHQSWQIRADGLNIRKNGSTGNTREHFYIPLDLPVRMARRDLTGKWQPVEALSPEAVC